MDTSIALIIVAVVIFFIFAIILLFYLANMRRTPIVTSVVDPSGLI
jgi:hypothetical protein